MLLATGCRHALTLTLQRDHSWLWRWWWRWWLWWWWWSGGGYKHHNHNGIWISFISFPWVASWLISIWGVTITSSPSQKKEAPRIRDAPRSRLSYVPQLFIGRRSFYGPAAFWQKVLGSDLVETTEGSQSFFLQLAVNLGRRLHRRMGCSTLISGSGFQRTTTPFIHKNHRTSKHIQKYDVKNRFCAINMIDRWKADCLRQFYSEDS